ncbi:MAG: TraR/DksA family transcriptional regulator [Pirellulaceae bacterium]
MKWKKSEMKPYKELLLGLRARLRGDVHTLADAALSSTAGSQGGSFSAVPSHIADMGSDTFELDNTLLLMSNEGETLSMIEQALERIEDGSFGICVECSGKIPKMRLNAIPYTPYCVKCAGQIESEKF